MAGGIENVLEDFLKKSVHTLHRIIGPRGLALSIRILSTLYQVSYTVCSLFYSTVSAVIDEFSTNGNLWVFRGNNTQPLPYKVFSKYPVDATWFYNQNANILYEALSAEAQTSSYVPLHSVKLPWIMSVLSCRIMNDSGGVAAETEWYLDDWASTFFMATDAHVISPKIILACWSIKSGVWFSNSDVIRLEVIDRNGDRVVFENINAQMTDAEVILWRKTLGLESLPPNAEETSGNEADTESNST
jgi:hypothetical protein